MILKERSFGGNLFRPRPEIHCDSKELIIIATPWGPRRSAKLAVQVMLDYFLSSRDDRETTSPFERLSCLSSAANNLRIAAMLANDAIWRRENNNEYLAGVEIFASCFFNQEFTWVQVGQPHLFLAKQEQQSLMPLSSSLDLALEMSQARELLPPLPNQMLGVDSSVNLFTSSYRPRKGDHLILLSRSDFPASLYSAPPEESKISEILANDDPNRPYWLGIIDIFES